MTRSWLHIRIISPRPCLRPVRSEWGRVTWASVSRWFRFAARVENYICYFKDSFPLSFFSFFFLNNICLPSFFFHSMLQHKASNLKFDTFLGINVPKHVCLSETDKVHSFGNLYCLIGMRLSTKGVLSNRIIFTNLCLCLFWHILTYFWMVCLRGNFKHYQLSFEMWGT